MASERINELLKEVDRAGRRLMVEVLRRAAALQEAGRTDELGQGSDKIDACVPRSSRALRIGWIF